MLSVGKLLQGAREKKSYRFAMLKKRIKVREQYLIALESDNWTEFSSRIYITGLLSNYARFLELDEKKILAFFRREYERKEEIKFKEKVRSSYLSTDSKKTLIGGFIFLFALLFGYFTYQLFQYLRPPTIQIISPITSTFKRELTVKLVGKTEKEAAITIMGERIYQNKEGLFEYILPLNKNEIILSIEVIGANGKKTILQKNLQNSNKFLNILN